MLRAGLIGFPSSGKTTLFHLMTQTARGRRTERARGGIPVGVSVVPDGRLEKLTTLFSPRKIVPATVEFIDIVNRTGPQAQFEVAPFRQCDALLHVVRVFREETVPHPSGSIDPLRDAKAMEDELILADLSVVERRLDRIKRDMKKNDLVELHTEQVVLERCKVTLENGMPLRTLSLESDTARPLRGFQLLSAKPLLIVVNLDESDLPHRQRASEISPLNRFLSMAMTHSVDICAKIELEIAELGPLEAQAFQTDLGLRESGLDRVIRASYKLLGYVSFFTVGGDECRAWSIPHGTSAQTAALGVHSDIARGFIRAEVVDYNQLITRGSLIACREHGEVRLEGKDYAINDGDVINFRFAT